MSNPAQGAVGAETMTAGLTLTFDPSKLFDAVAQVGDGGAHLGSRLVGIMLSGARSTFLEDLGLAFYGVTAAPSLASPRADSDERTAGNVDRSIVAALNGINVVEAAEEYEFCPDEGSHTPTEFEKALLIDFAYGLMNTVHEAVRPLVSATPAQPAGAVPDSLRALPLLEIRPVAEALHERLDRHSWAALCRGGDYGLPGTEQHWLKVAEAAIIVVRDALGASLLASHPAGQSAGSGAEPRRMAEGCCSAVSPCSHQQRDPYSLCAICEKANGLTDKIQAGAPDSTCTGQAEALRSAMIRALDGHTAHSRDCHMSGDYLCQQVWPLVEAALAARPAAPEAQGAWRERAATEIDAIAQQWGTEGDVDGRAYAKTLAAILRAEQSAPPASYGQEG